jgi:WD40 repeat protein
VGNWNFEKLKATKSVAIKADLLCVVRTPNSEQLWIGSSDFKIYSLDLSAEKPQPVVLEGHTSYVSGVVLAGNTLISGSWDRKLIWWDAEKRQSIRTVEAHQRWIRRLVLSPDQRQDAARTQWA